MKKITLAKILKRKVQIASFCIVVTISMQRFTVVRNIILSHDHFKIAELLLRSTHWVQTIKLPLFRVHEKERMTCRKGQCASTDKARDITDCN